MKKLVYAALAFVLAILLTAPMHAQLLQGVIEGNVTDSSGAGIPGAQVSATNEQTGLTRNTETNEVGSYSFPTVNVGTFTIKITMEGFQTSVETGVNVRPNAVTRVDMALQVGQVSETVTVESTAAVLQTDRAEVRQEVTEKQLKNLPVPLGRNYQMLFVTLPGFSPPQNGHSVPTNPSRSVQFSVNGTSRSNNNTRIDGASTTNIWVPHMTGYNPALESIEQVNVVTNSFDAEQGLAGGAAINLTIKSGTNSIHGSAFEYHANQHQMAYPFFSNRNSAKPKFIYNQFGGTVGGPIKKNKLFYFLSYEGTREAQFAQRIVNVPSAAMKQGDLSGVYAWSSCNSAMTGLGGNSDCGIYDPLTGDGNGRGRSLFANQLIPQSRIDVGIQKIVTDSRYPDPNLAGSGNFGLTNNYYGNGSTTFFRDTIDSKVNWNISDKLTAFVRFSMLDYRMLNDQVFGEFGGVYLHPTNSNPGKGFGNTYSGTASVTYVANPNLVFDAYYGYTLVDTNVEQTQLDQNIGWDLLGIPGLQSSRKIDGGWPQLTIGGFQQLGISNNFQPYYRNDPQNQYVANGNLTKGTHNIRFGADFYNQDLNHNQPEFPSAIGGASGRFDFQQGMTRNRGAADGSTADSRGTDFNSFASFLLGQSNQAGKIWLFPDDGYTTRTKYYSMHLRDRWQINPRLTFNYGIRAEFFPFPTRSDRGVERYDFNTNNMLLCGVGPTPKDCGVTVGRRQVLPRAGLAYRATDTFVIRAGYGITSDPFNWARPLRTNYPIMAVQNLTQANSWVAATTLREGLPVVTAPDTASGVLPQPLTAAATVIEPTNAVRGYIQSWNLTMEKRVGSWIGSAGYVATRSINQIASLEQNWSYIGEGNAGRQLNLRFPGRIASTALHGSLGTPKYDSLQTKLERRFANGYQVNFSYTWSHARGYTSEDSGAASDRIRVPWLYNRSYSRLPQDIRHNFQFSSIAESPFGKGKKYFSNGGVGGAVLGGWQFNHLLSWYSGQPFTVTSANDISAAESSQLGDCIATPTKLGFHGDEGLFYDPSAFQRPPSTRFGSCGFNNLSGAPLFNLDLGLFRKFQATEKFDIQFRAELFNATNTPHFNTPNGDVTSGNFMKLTSIKNVGREGIDQRFFRVGIRLGW
ncbi:MAG: TonB-dependent receptor [Acidobacteria bacterium]|nr:TonB-dependent receptor [Acidobacteriota bacterium]